MKNLLIIPFLFIFLACHSQTKNPDQSINSTFTFELNNYLGTWYEIARFDHSFERGLQGVTATYSLRSDGKIKVLNQGYKGSLEGKQKTAVGKARLASDETPRNLEVSFFWNFYGTYNILEIDENYQYVLIGSGSPKYLWILSRTPQMDETTFDMLLKNAEKRGYDTDKLIIVDQVLTETD
ncbi:MAG: lipocalin family protein [Prolixibacteraceae bacterium]